MKTLYLNNRGSRWVTLDKNGKKEKIVFSYEGEVLERTVIEWRLWGNSAYALVSIKGKKKGILDGLISIGNDN